MKKQRKNVLETMAGLVINFLEETYKIQYFIGGSCRFGWLDNQSDIDIFIYLQKKDVKAITLLLNHEYGFEEKLIDYYQQPAIQLVGFHDLVHLNLFHEFSSYEALLKEHEIIYKLIDGNKTLIEFIKVLKRKIGISGAEIFRTLKLILFEEQK